MKQTPGIFVALPLIDELEHLPSLLGCCKNQSFKNFEVFVCVNQPDNWWDDPQKRIICENNRQTIQMLTAVNEFPVRIVDKSSPGKGWTGKQSGVGWARKTCMDEICKVAEDKDIILSLDGDTIFSERYFQAIIDGFKQNQATHSIAVPYYHQLTSNETANHAILRYEIYMRYYTINLLRIGFPYAFTALGSAMASTVKAYRRVGGLTPHKSGEDFYFLQKLKKSGSMLINLSERVYPAARFSNRVFFGTGPAMIKGAAGDWTSYPVYNYRYFDEIESTINQFRALCKHDIETPMSHFFEEKFGKGPVWQPLRENVKDSIQFEKACFIKIDGLRVLQYLKWRHQQNEKTDEENLKEFLRKFYDHDEIREILPDSLSLTTCSIATLNRIRDFLFLKEEEWQRKIRILQ